LWRSAGWQPIFDCVEFLRELLGWLADLLGPLGEHLVHRQAGHALAQGRVACSLKVLSGRQPGLSSRWRNGVAVISPGRLDFTPQPGQLRANHPLTHIVVLGGGRLPSGEELPRLPGDCRIFELQTPTAKLGWAVPAGDLLWALGHLQNEPVAPSREAQPAQTDEPSGSWFPEA
jgi:hypothetical protein